MSGERCATVCCRAQCPPLHPGPAGPLSPEVSRSLGPPPPLGNPACRHGSPGRAPWSPAAHVPPPSARGGEQWGGELLRGSRRTGNKRGQWTNKMVKQQPGVEVETGDAVQENAMGQLTVTRDLREVPGCPLWRGLRHHRPVYSVSCNSCLFSNCHSFS